MNEVRAGFFKSAVADGDIANVRRDDEGSAGNVAKDRPVASEAGS